MALGDKYAAYIEERLGRFGSIRIRKMFGGAGVYCDGLFIALLDDDMLYFKADDATREAFEKEGLKRFIFQPKDGPAMAMNYYAAPETAYEDDDELRRWTALALEAARRQTAGKPKKTAKSKVTEAATAPKRKPRKASAAKRGRHSAKKTAR